MKDYTDVQINANRLYLEALSERYPDIRATAAEIINLQAILDLPKGTEHFMSDVHGEYEAFRHILNNASGSVREKIDILFSDTLTSERRAELATLVYYPKAKLKELVRNAEDEGILYLDLLTKLIAICRLVSSKYTRSKVRKALPRDLSYILEELLFSPEGDGNRSQYRNNILLTIIELGQAERLIIDLSDTIKRLVVDRLHIVGDIFDRGSRPDIVLDDLMEHHGVDVQWGNHDILW